MLATVRRPYRWYGALGEGWGEGLGYGALALALLFYYVGASPWVAALGALAFVGLAWWRLDLALVFPLLTAPFYRFPKVFDPALWGVEQLLGRTRPLEFSLMEFTILGCGAAWLVRQGHRLWASKESWQASDAGLKKMLRALVSPVVLLLGASLLSLTASQERWVSLRELRTVIVEPLLFYALLVQSRDGWATVRRFLLAFVLLGAAMAVISLYHYFFIGVVEATGGVRRLLAIYHSPNALALFLGRVLPIGVGLALAPSSEALRARWRPFFILGAALVVLALFFTYSRGAWLAVVGALLFVAALQGRRMLLVGAGVALAAFLLVLPLAGGWGRLFSEVTNQQRLYVWEAALAMIRDSPLLGVGLDNFLHRYPQYMRPEAWAEPNVSHPHNVLLDFWTRLGLLGVGALLWLEVVFWRRGWHLLHQGLAPGQRLMVLALMAGMVELLVHGLVDNSFFLVDLAMVFWLFYGLMRLATKGDS